MSDPQLPRLQWSSRNKTPPKTEAKLSRADSDATTTLIEGDNLSALDRLADECPSSVMLAYLDPPFLTGREHFHVERTRSGPGHVTRSESRAFDDRWRSLSEYLDVLEPRLHLVRELLAPEGCLVLHVDPKTSHYVKVICDEIFGPECFASEVIWRYRRWPSKTKNFQRVHDVMLRYVKDATATPRFNQLYEPLALSTQKTWGDRKQRAVTDESGRRLRSSKTEEKTRGTPLGDVWEIGIVAPVARERTGYPTQKPEALLHRWIEACTNPGDLVLDPYMGSGTTLAVAHKLGRRSIGIDLGGESHRVTRARLEELGVPFVQRTLLKPLARGKARTAPVESIAG